MRSNRVLRGSCHILRHLNGQPVSGTGIFESTLALYCNRKLVDVLSDSVANLAASSSGSNSIALRQLVDNVRAHVSVDLLRDNRVAAKVYLEEQSQTLGLWSTHRTKRFMLEIWKRVVLETPPLAPITIYFAL
jgi:hypothetical protein